MAKSDNDTDVAWCKELLKLQLSIKFKENVYAFGANDDIKSARNQQLLLMNGLSASIFTSMGVSIRSYCYPPFNNKQGFAAFTSIMVFSGALIYTNFVYFPTQYDKIAGKQAVALKYGNVAWDIRNHIKRLEQERVDNHTTTLAAFRLKTNALNAATASEIASISDELHRRAKTYAIALDKDFDPINIKMEEWEKLIEHKIHSDAVAMSAAIRKNNAPWWKWW